LNRINNSRYDANSLKWHPDFHLKELMSPLLEKLHWPLAMW